jgi:YVTN family beta-propeller protein
MKLILFSTVLVCSLSAQKPAYLVSQKAASSVAWYSPEGKQLASVNVGKHPHEMVISADGKYLYTTDNGTMKIEQQGTGGNTVSIIDLTARKKVGEISLGEYRRPHGIDFDEKTGRLLVSTELPDQLLIIDPQKRSILRKYDTKGKTSHMVTLGPGGQYAYVSNSNSANVAAINLQSGEVKPIPTGKRPEGSVLSSDGKELYVANREGASITVIDTARNEAVATISTGNGPVRIGITPDGSTLVYALMHDKKIGLADARKRRQVATVDLSGTPVSLNISPDGKQAFVAAEEQDTVYVISIADRKLVNEFKTPQGTGPDPVLAIPAK